MKGKIALSLLVLILCLSFLPVACGDEEEPTGEPPESITLWTLADMSGPYATVMAPMVPALADVDEYVNTVLGGINGVPIESKVKDFGGDIAIGLSAYEELRAMSPKPLTFFGWVTDLNEVLKERVAEDEIPYICTASDLALYPPAYSFGFHATYIDTFGAFLDWLVENWTEDRPPKVAILTWDTAYGRAVIRDEGEAYAQELGVEIVATELFGIQELECTTQLTRIRAEEPDWIYTNTLVTGPVTILKSAQDLGYDINLAGGYGIGWMDMGIGGADLFEGVVVIKDTVSWDDVSNPIVQELRGIVEENERDPSVMDNVYASAFAYTLMAVEAIQAAVDEVGWDGLDGEAVHDQLIKGEYTPMGGIIQANYTEDIRSLTKVSVCQIQDGKIMPITPFRQAPDLKEK
ncbi:MAG: ABC transporter substrate-binding protein [Dehalococcoidia bacterium]|nr:MAG: ABC transporter substrate-binding protein [Dehalococcoidia bacterium]